jgi:hypothetical protein
MTALWKKSMQIYRLQGFVWDNVCTAADTHIVIISALAKSQVNYDPRVRDFIMSLEERYPS